MRRTHRLVVLVFAVAGCSTGAATSPFDAGMEASDPGPTPGSEFYPWDGSVGLFGACTADHQCQYAAGAQCLTAYPGGLCTVRCNPDDPQCGAGACVQNVCMPTCSSTPDNCQSLGAMCEDDSYCLPSCGAGAPPCAAGMVCDAYSGGCTTQLADSGADNGAPCASDDQCLGFCITQTTPPLSGSPSGGYLGGMCVSYARAPAHSAFADGGLLPTSNCPAGSVIVPPINAAGDMELCMPECHRDSDCRSGYACWTTDGTLTYADGYCAPIDCHDGVHQCPAPSACVPDAGTCAP